MLKKGWKATNGWPKMMPIDGDFHFNLGLRNPFNSLRRSQVELPTFIQCYKARSGNERLP